MQFSLVDCQFSYAKWLLVLFLPQKIVLRYKNLMVVPFHCVLEPCSGALTIADLKETAVENCKEFLEGFNFGI